MSDKEDRTSGMKSAYELALERLDSQGIDRPRALDEKLQRQIAEVRAKADADLAKLEILHRERMSAESDPLQASQAEEEYGIDRRRLEERRDDAIARLRDG